MVKKILMTLDKSPFSKVAMDHAIQLGKFHKAEVTGMAIVHRRRLTNVGPVPIGANCCAKSLRKFRFDETKNHINKIVSSFKSSASDAGIDHRIELQDGDPFHLMVLHASKYDLIITGLRKIFDYDVVPEPRNLLWRIASAGVSPILAVGQEFNPIRRVFVAYTQPLDSANILTKLLKLKIWPDVSIRLGYFSENGAEPKDLLLEATSECSTHGLNIECKSLKGPAKENLFLQAKEWDADLIAINGSVRRFFFRRVFNDNVMFAIRHSNKPLFLM